ESAENKATFAPTTVRRATISPSASILCFLTFRCFHDNMTTLYNVSDIKSLKCLEEILIDVPTDFRIDGRKMIKQEERNISHALYNQVFTDNGDALICDLCYICIGPYNNSHASIYTHFLAIERLLKRYHPEELSMFNCYIDSLCNSSLKENKSASSEKAATGLLNILLRRALAQSQPSTSRYIALKQFEAHYIDGAKIKDMLSRKESYFTYYSDSDCERRVLYKVIERGKNYLAAVTCGLMFSAFWDKLSDKDRQKLIWASEECDPRLSLL
ncbi:MAG: hypothetical protein LUI39_10705, partial [Lachnospiraceae bacterium]|nr:hypothetical protein [Lachnospiraceae bacterium]